MKDKRALSIFILLLIIASYILCITNSSIFIEYPTINYLVFGLILVYGIYVIYITIFKVSDSSYKSKEKLFNSLLENADTVYFMIDAKNNDVIYVSNNIEEILGIKYDSNAVFKLLDLPIIKDELKSWNKTDKYVGQMITYDNPLYNHQMWIRLKAFSCKTKRDEYYIIEIIDSTKEHDKQHLLLTQATDIKARESQLNQITSKSYDMEMNINLNNNSYDLKYFKKDNLYFGEEKRGIYTSALKEITNKYINESDRKMFYETLCLENLKDHFAKYELDSVSVRYRIGMEVKNNIWLESTIFFLTSRQGNKVSILTKDVTSSAESIREQNVMLQNALNELKIASKSKTELISTISHDIRTPLTNIIGLSDDLVSKKLDEGVLDDIRNINDSSKDVLNIIDGLLDAENIEKHLSKKQENEYSIYKLFTKLEENAKEYIGNKDISFELNLDNNLPVVLYGDSNRITSALMQILNNSVKYTDEGKISVDVKGKKVNNNVNLAISVIDTGKGIDEQTLKTIMESKDGNTGLYRVKKIIKLLDGKFEIESKLNEYTKVTITLSQRIVEDNKVRTMIDNNKKAEVFSLKGKRILLVDDNELNLKVTNKMLSAYEVDTTLVTSGEECVELVTKQNNFDLILLDQMMPGMDGITTMDTLRKIKGFKTPIVVLTADAMNGQKEKYLASGFDDYISKPIDKSELSRVLKKFLKQD